jgi:hypothetical protein
LSKGGQRSANLSAIDKWADYDTRREQRGKRSRWSGKLILR